MKNSRGNSSLTRAVAAGLLVPVLGCFAAQATAASSASALQRKLEQMEDEMRMLRQELQNVKSEEPAQARQVEQLQQRVDTVEATTKEVDTRSKTQTHHDNMLFFRGGWSGIQDSRAFTSFTDQHLGGVAGLPVNGEDEGWYVGGGLDFILTHDIWGMMRDTWVIGELSIGFNRIGSAKSALVVPTAECALLSGNVGLGGGVANCVVTGNNVMTTLNITAAPKIKFMEGSKVRPWIMPVGLDINVISPPSDSASVLDVGAVFGAGVDYELMKGIFIGIDGRYHYTAGETNTKNNFVQKTNAALASTGVQLSGDTDHDNDYWQVGGYLGIGF
jgi:hypothetical protein